MSSPTQTQKPVTQKSVQTLQTRLGQGLKALRTETQREAAYVADAKKRHDTMQKDQQRRGTAGTTENECARRAIIEGGIPWKEHLVGHKAVALKKSEQLQKQAEAHLKRGEKTEAAADLQKALGLVEGVKHLQGWHRAEHAAKLEVDIARKQRQDTARRIDQENRALEYGGLPALKSALARDKKLLQAQIKEFERAKQIYSKAHAPLAPYEE